MDNKKKIGIGLIGLVLVIVIVLSFTIKENYDDVLSSNPNEIIANAEKESSSIKEKEMREHTKINMDKFFEYYNDKAKRIILFARPSCHYCEIAEPIIKNLAYTYSLTIYYVDTEEITEEEKNKLESTDDFFKTLGTPTLIIIENNKIKDTLEGLTDQAHYKEFLRKNEIIK